MNKQIRPTASDLEKEEVSVKYRNFIHALVEREPEPVTFSFALEEYMKLEHYVPMPQHWLEIVKKNWSTKFTFYDLLAQDLLSGKYLSFKEPWFSLKDKEKAIFNPTPYIERTHNPRPYCYAIGLVSRYPRLAEHRFVQETATIMKVSERPRQFAKGMLENVQLPAHVRDVVENWVSANDRMIGLLIDYVPKDQE